MSRMNCRDHACPLCGGKEASLYYQDNNKRSTRPYFQCLTCSLVFVPAIYYLTAEQEKAEYDLHENDLQDAGYHQFLQRFWQPFKACLAEQGANHGRLSGAEILEFGCGPGPALAGIMENDGYSVSKYDYFYFPDKVVLQTGAYDGISATEVIEHLHKPKQVFESWLGYLKPDGVLGLMTKLVKDQQAFANWHYKNDLTHVCFYSQATFQWLANHYGLILQIIGNDVIVLHKQP